MDTVDTKIGFAETLLDLTAVKPYEKVSVADIVTAASKNRATFYYHFEDKAQLTAWVFRRDLATLLEEEFVASELVFEETSANPCSALPYYARTQNKSRSIDASRFIELLAQVLENHRGFYAQALKAQGPGSLDNYLYQLYLPAITEDIRIMMHGRKLAGSNVGFLAEFFTNALLSFFKRRLEMPGGRPLLEGAEPFLNILHSSLERQIDAMQLACCPSTPQSSNKTCSFNKRKDRTTALALAQ